MCERDVGESERETKGLRQRQRYREGGIELSNGTVVTWDSGRMTERGRELSQPVERGEKGCRSINRWRGGSGEHGDRTGQWSNRAVVKRGSGQRVVVKRVVVKRSSGQTG